MANQELVVYLRKHWKHGPDLLRQKLIAEGLDEAEIDSAIAEAAPKPKAKPTKTAYIIFGAITLAIFILLNMRHGSEDSEHGATSGSKPAVVQENPNDPHQAFLGHYGYVLRLPLGYDALADFKDPEKTVEIVYIFPKGSDLNNLANEDLYGPLNILRLEVSPRRIPSGRIGLTVVRGQIMNSLQKNGVSYSMRETMVDGLQVLVVNVQGPSSKERAFVIGSKVVYVLTGGSENQLFTDTLLSLHELSPHDKPGSE